MSLSWLIDFAVECYAAAPDDLNVCLPKQPDGVIVQRLEVEADEAWSFVGKKTKAASKNNLYKFFVFLFFLK